MKRRGRACGNCEKAQRSWRGFFKPRWESAFFADFHQRRQFPQAFFGFAFFCSSLFFQKNLALGRPRNDASCFRRPVASPDLLSAPRFQRSRMEIASSSCPFLGQAGFQAWPIGFALDHEIVGVAGKTIDGTLRPHGIGKRG